MWAPLTHLPLGTRGCYPSGGAPRSAPASLSRWSGSSRKAASAATRLWTGAWASLEAENRDGFSTVDDQIHPPEWIYITFICGDDIFINSQTLLEYAIWIITLC